MRLDEIERQLPWGFHDAYVERMDIEWTAARLRMYMRVMMSERQDLDQRAVVTMDGLVYCSMEPPELKGTAAAAEARDGLWVQPDEIDEEKRPAGLPPTPRGAFLHRFYVTSWNAFFYICAREATFTWLEGKPEKARAGTRALFAGDVVGGRDEGDDV
jgi:hypothetical protein